MGLDAVVYCDCLEQNRLRTLPQSEWAVHVDESGARSAHTADLDQDLAFDRWNADACEHEDGILVHAWLGNISAVGLIRVTLLETTPGGFPLILTKVVYSGSHCGDYVPFVLVDELRQEVDRLAQIHPEDNLANEWVRDFEHKMRALIEAATTVRKPISF